jgi:hypothetical protein
MVTATTKRRLAALEAATGGESGCERCSGLLVTVSDAITGEHHSATWNGAALTAEALAERETEVRCPVCGRDMSGDDSPVITIGGRK